MQSELEGLSKKLSQSSSIEEARIIIDEALSRKRKLIETVDPKTTFDSQTPGVVYRGCQIDPVKEKMGIQLSRLSHPPSHLVKKHGRCNRLGRPVFYCSTMEIGAYSEINLRVGEHAIVTHWDINSAVPLMNVGDTYHRNRPVTPPRPELRVEDIAIDQWLTEKFTQEVQEGEEAPYYSTIAIAEKLLIPEKVAALLYPSMKRRHNKSKTIDNLAIEPWFVKQHMSWRLAEHIEITAVRDGEYDIKRLDFAEELTKDKALIWHGRPARLYDQFKNEYDFTSI